MSQDRSAGTARRRSSRLRAASSPDAIPSALEQHQDTPEFPIRGRQRLALIRDIAIGEWNTDSLAQMYGIPVQVLSDFAGQHAEEIQEVSAALSGTLDIATAGLWITKKQKRLAEYQQAIDDIDEELQALREAGLRWSRAHRDMFRARLDLYRQAADELGAYPQRSAAPSRQGLGVQYIIDSEDAGEMT